MGAACAGECAWVLSMLLPVQSARKNQRTRAPHSAGPLGQGLGRGLPPPRVQGPPDRDFLVAYCSRDQRSQILTVRDRAPIQRGVPGNVAR